jgi:CRISPR/Cas system-associated protein Cas10 (large subunit of type III CRISPR-Cas system)
MDYYNVIDISKGSLRSDGNKKYFCDYCRRSLFLKDKETYEFICTFCNILYYPNNQLLKKSNRFDLPGPDTDSQGNVTGNNTIPIAMIDDPNKELSSTSYKQQKLPAAYEALRKQGFKFINYEER